VKIMAQFPALVRYLFAALTVAAALGVRMLLVPWTGVGAPFVFFFATVLVSSFLWGSGPGLLAGIMSVSLAGFLFVYQAGYTVSQAVAQSILFLCETTIVSILANRFGQAKRRAERNALTARRAEAQIEDANKALLRRDAEIREAQRLASVGNWTWDVKRD